MSTERVWTRFSAQKSDGTMLNLRIQDLPKERFEDVMEFNNLYFAPEETFHRAAGVHKNPEALEECKGFVSEMMRDPIHRIVICCSDDDPGGQLLGVSCVALSSKDDDEEIGDLEIKTPEMEKYFELLFALHSLYDVMKEQNLEKCFDGRSIVVHPGYRRLGIAKELVNVRRLMCKHYEVPATCAWMTSQGSQKAAQNNGWETIFEISYEELAKRHNLTFTNVPSMCKLMMARIDTKKKIK